MKVAQSEVPGVRRWHLYRFTGAVLTAAALLLLPNCVYFNLFYNARNSYESAVETPLQPDGSVNRTALEDYKAVIEKCEKLIEEHPDSKYVDDALLLMSKAYYAREEYPEAIARLQQLIDEYPKSELAPEAGVYLARAYIDNQQRFKAAALLKPLIEANPKSDYLAEMLYLAGTNLAVLQKDDEAFVYLERLAKQYPETTYRMEADLEIARLNKERGNYEKSLATLEALGKRKLKFGEKLRYYTELSDVKAKMGDYPGALDAIMAIDEFQMGDRMLATHMLRKGQALAGVDSVQTAIGMYENVASRFPRSLFSAEAEFKLGVLYQDKLDSLDVAKAHFDQVPRQYPKSDFAAEAIQRSVSITKIKRLESSLAGGGNENGAALKFDLAETQLFQFKDYEKALAGYREVLETYPNSEVAPKAAYAIGYIYSECLKDVDKARLAYSQVVNAYPDSQQAQYAREFLEKNTQQLESRNQ